MSRFFRFLDENGDTRPLAVARIGIGLLLLHEAWEAGYGFATGGFFGDRFHLPSLPPSLLPSRAVYLALIVVQALLALAVIAGRFARPALLAGAIALSYQMLSDRLAYHNYRYSLLLFAGLLALAPCDRQLVIGGARRDPIGPLWAQRLAQWQVSIMYLASGGSKLLDGDWRGGRVFADGIARFTPTAIQRGAPAIVVHWLGQAAVSATLARLSIATELLLAIALWPRRTRAVALWIGLWFHLLIDLTTSVAIFSWLMLAIYALFATTDGAARRLRAPPRMVRAVRMLDWLGRFTVEAEENLPLLIVDRDGTRAAGVDAKILLLRTLPIFFPLWLPFAALRRATFLFRRRQPSP